MWLQYHKLTVSSSSVMADAVPRTIRGNANYGTSLRPLVDFNVFAWCEKVYLKNSYEHCVVWYCQYLYPMPAMKFPICGWSCDITEVTQRLLARQLSCLLYLVLFPTLPR